MYGSVRVTNLKGIASSIKKWNNWYITKPGSEIYETRTINIMKLWTATITNAYQCIKIVLYTMVNHVFYLQADWNAAHENCGSFAYVTCLKKNNISLNWDVLLRVSSKYLYYCSCVCCWKYCYIRTVRFSRINSDTQKNQVDNGKNHSLIKTLLYECFPFVIQQLFNHGDIEHVIMLHIATSNYRRQSSIKINFPIYIYSIYTV